MSDTFFFVTGVAYYPKQASEHVRLAGGLGPSRCFGYYPTFEEAESALIRCSETINECLYSYAVIEEIVCGSIHAIPSSEHWYKFKGEFGPEKLPEGEYISIEKPKELKSFVNFSGVG